MPALDSAALDPEVANEIKTVLAEHLDKKLTEFRAATDRLIRERTAGGGGFTGLTASNAGETVGKLVTKDGRFTSLQTAGRGIAQVAINRRLVESKATITMGPTLKPGMQTLPVVPLPGPAPTVADLIPSRAMSEGSLMVVRQKSPHPVAGVQVLEGDPKTEATFVFESLTVNPATLAIWVAASRQSLRDVSGLSMVIDNQLMYAVQTLEEQEILNGDGTPGHLHGLLPQAPSLAPVVGDSALDAVARAIAALAASGVRASGAVMNPADWLTVALAKDTTESYLLGSPASATAALVWGVPLALSAAMTPGSFLVGNFTLGAELAYREQAVIDISTEHSDFFIRNLICVRAEESLALAVKQPTYFLKSTLPAGAVLETAKANGGRK